MTKIHLHRARYAMSQMPNSIASLILDDGEPLVLNDSVCYIGDGSHRVDELTPVAYPSASISSVRALGDVMSKSANTALLPLDLKGHTLTSNERIAEKGFDLAGIVDPVKGGGLYGPVDVVEQAYYSAGWNIFIEQTLTNKRLSQYQPVMKFRRQGYVLGQTDADLLDPSTWNVTWQEWYPIDYPTFRIDTESSNVSGGSIHCAVRGGNATIRLNEVKCNSTYSSFIQLDSNTASIGFLKNNAFQTADTSPSYLWTRVGNINVAKTCMMGLSDAPHILLWKPEASTAYSGEMHIPLGY